MSVEKKFVKYRYVFDIDTGTLHDMRSEHNPTSEGCGLENIENWVAFDTDRQPMENALIKKLTATREVVDIEVRKLCPACMKSEDEDLIDLLQDYFLTQIK